MIKTTHELSFQSLRNMLEKNNFKLVWIKKFSFLILVNITNTRLIVDGSYIDSGSILNLVSMNTLKLNHEQR